MTPAPAPVQPGRRSAPRWLPTLAALLVMTVTALAGRWQLHRAQEKSVLQAQLEARMQAAAIDLNALLQPGQAVDADGLRFRHAHAQGRYLAAGQIYIDNRELDGRTGWHVLTPLDLGGQAVLVNRGFLPRGAGYPQAPQVPVPAGTQQVDGQLSLARSRFLELSADTVNGAVWQNLKLEQYAARTGLKVLPVVLLADPPGSGLAAVHEQPDANIAMHRGYMIQWFALCAATGALWLYYTFLRRTPTTP